MIFLISRFGDERAAGKAPHAAVNHADAEAGAGLHAAGAEAERVGDDAVADRDAVVDVAREANVGVAAAEALGLVQRHVRQALEARIHDARLRRLRDQIADQVAGIERHAGGAESLYEVSSSSCML